MASSPATLPHRPPATATARLRAPPPNYLVWSIITILLCTIPGIVAIVYSTQVNSKWGTGDAAGAYDASKKAKMWALIGTILGVVALVAYIGLMAAGVFASTATYNWNS